MFSLYTLSFRESWGNLSFSSFGDKTSTNYLWVSLIPKRRINWFNFQLRVDTIGCETQTKIRWITTINNHTSFQNKINCFKLHRTVCDSYDKVTLLKILTSKLLAFLSMCVQMSRPKGHVGPALPSPWFKALYFLGCYILYKTKTSRELYHSQTWKPCWSFSLREEKKLV